MDHEKSLSLIALRSQLFTELSEITGFHVGSVLMMLHFVGLHQQDQR